MRITARQRIGLIVAFAFAYAPSPAALADVVPIVSAKSAVDHLSKKELADIFLGRTSRLPNGEQVVPIDQDEGCPARDQFYETIVGKTAAELRAYWSKIIFTGRGQPPLAVPSGVEERKLIATNPNAIGYLDKSQLDRTVKAVRID